MKVILETGQILDDEIAYIRYREISGGKAESLEVLNWNEWGMAEYQPPTVPDGYKQTNVLVDMETYWTHRVIEKTTEDIKAETYVYQITPRQCRLWLAQHGLLTNVELAIAAQGASAQIEWEYALEIKRDHALVLGMQQVLGKTGDEMHQMFWEASQL
jgi:hypothetical protein